MIARVEAEGFESLIEGMPARWLTPELIKARPDLVERLRAMIATNTVEGYVHCAGAITRLAFMDRLSEIKLPTLLICGAQDLGTPISGMREMEKRIAGSRYVEIDPAGHLSNIENPEAFDSALAEFLDAQPR
jgi:3-oxoadipate enol-lactonase